MRNSPHTVSINSFFCANIYGTPFVKILGGSRCWVHMATRIRQSMIQNFWFLKNWHYSLGYNTWETNQLHIFQIKLILKLAWTQNKLSGVTKSNRQTDRQLKVNVYCAYKWTFWITIWLNKTTNVFFLSFSKFQLFWNPLRTAQTSKTWSDTSGKYHNKFTTLSINNYWWYLKKVVFIIFPNFWHLHILNAKTCRKML